MPRYEFLWWNERRCTSLYSLQSPISPSDLPAKFALQRFAISGNDQDDKSDKSYITYDNSEFQHKELMRFQMQHRFGLEQRQTKHTFMIERTEHRRNHLGIDKPWKLWKYLQGSETRTNFMSIISRSMQFAKIQLPLHSDIWWFLVLWLSFRVFVYVPGSLCSSLFKSVQVCSSLFKSVLCVSACASCY